jgi:hypothetical protein
VSIRSLLVPLLLCVFAFALASLLTGAPWLELRLPGGLPFGNALVAAGLCAATGAALASSRTRSILRNAAWIALALAGAWLPVSLLLAGNVELNFDGERGVWWWRFSLIVMLVSLVTLLWALLAAVARWVRTRRTGD